MIGGQKVGFNNIYAPNLRGDCILLWKELLSWAHLADSWVIGGDFNMVDFFVNKKGGREGGIHPLKRAAWDAFLFNFNGTDGWLEDAFII